jgi:hypothetical protein
MDQALNNNMDRTVERLLASKEKLMSEAKAKGRDWAKHSASYRDLTAIADIEFFPDDVAHAEYVRHIVSLGYSSDFWGDLTGDHVRPNDAYVDAFIEGASEVLAEVEDKLE